MPILGTNTTGLSVMGVSSDNIGNHTATCWDPAMKRVVDVSVCNTRDVQPDYGSQVLRDFSDFLYLTNFKRHYEDCYRQYQQNATFNVHDVVQVMRGNSAPVGTVGVIVHTVSAHYGSKGLAKKHCIATTDVTTDRQSNKSSRTYTAHKDVVWAWARNLSCVILNPRVLLTIDTSAKADVNRVLSNLGMPDLNNLTRQVSSLGPEYGYNKPPVTSIDIEVTGSGYSTWPTPIPDDFNIWLESVITKGNGRYRG